MPRDLVPIRRALLSVSDKSGLVDLARALAEHGAELVSTGGTARALRGAGLEVRDVSALTGVPEMLEGRVKTLHPAVHGGLLARRDRDDHMAAIEAAGIGPIDLLVSNLYPFETTAASGADPEAVIEDIDIGGPAMIRAAAKNHSGVAVLTDPGQYALLREAFAAHGGTDGPLRAHLAAAAFALTAQYDAAVAAWMAARTGETDTTLPAHLTFVARRAEQLRYGENPHQRGAFYRFAEARMGVATARQLSGKPLSWNNINDTDAAFGLVAEFPLERAACVIVKHATPAGVAVAATQKAAWQAAFDCDRTSAFGGIVAFNHAVDAATAEVLSGVFTEVVIAPEVAEDALARLAKESALRVLVTDGLPDPSAPGRSFRSVGGGLLLQDSDAGTLDAAKLEVVSARAPTDTEMADLRFAWRVVKHVKSNAVVFAKDGATIGIGAGQMSRVDSVRLAAAKASQREQISGLERATAGSVLASDAFFPFADGLEAARDAGVVAVIQPGGSKRDAEVIAAADAAGMAMVFTGMRHFRH
ncbi:MAG: bifunctional phosphoribosylaminoimidazolecarboxamide formyltransferase/IMP cyclohydrolase [Pseudomonadota bacterium]